MENVLNKIFTPKCLFCNKVGRVFCQNCLSACEIIKNQICIKCDKPANKGLTHHKCQEPNLPERLITIFKYEGLARECIRKSKYNSKYFSSLKELSYEACKLIEEQELDKFFKDKIAVSIPLSKRKEKIRGFNQVDIITDRLCKEFGLVKENSVLTRIKDTPAQHAYNRSQRFLNMEGCFTASKYRVKGKNFLVIDDITTTGATLIEASRVLMENGASSVTCFALSKKLLE